MTYAYAKWRLDSASAIEFAAADLLNPRPVEVPSFEGHNLLIATANVLNYFLTLADDASFARGANNVEEFERMAAKTTMALSMIDADILALVELENGPLADMASPFDFTADTATAAAASSGSDLCDRLNAANPDRMYKSVTFEAGAALVGNDAIRADIFYDANVVKFVGVAASLVDDVAGWTSTPTMNYAAADPSLLAADADGVLFSGKLPAP